MLKELDGDVQKTIRTGITEMIGSERWQTAYSVMFGAPVSTEPENPLATQRAQRGETPISDPIMAA
jgi:hypothetical protein